MLTILGHFALLIIALILFFGRTKAKFKIDGVNAQLPGFYTHISNFSISYMLFSGVGFIWLLLGLNFRYVLGLGLAILACNILYESGITVLNTPDRIDAYYGFWGTMLALLFLSLIKKYGLKVNDNR